MQKITASVRRDASRRSGPSRSAVRWRRTAGLRRRSAAVKTRRGAVTRIRAVSVQKRRNVRESGRLRSESRRSVKPAEVAAR